MITRIYWTAIVSIVIVAIACGGGSVAPFAPCTSTDTCPQSTVCESAMPTGATFCTWSCNNDDFGGQSCPNDATGVKGVCISSIDGVTIGQEYSYGFCFQDCSSGGTCPTNETCQTADPYSSGSAMVCVPIPADTFSGTTWASATIATTAKTSGVSSSTYTMTFGATNLSVAGDASGPFTATLTQTYAASAFNYAGCTETTTFTGGQWVDAPPHGVYTGLLGVSNATGSTDRTHCNMSSDNTTGMQGIYDDAVNQENGANYTLSGSTLMLNGAGGVVPYDDEVEWTFTEN